MSKLLNSQHCLKALENIHNENNTNKLINILCDVIEYAYLADNRPWIIGYSGGKDSTTVCHLVFETLIRLKNKNIKLHKPVYIISSDTLVENPLVLNYLKTNSNLMAQSAKQLGLPIFTDIVKPELQDTFWTCVIGKGYPTPKSIGYRWCTDRLKINPSNKYIKEKIKENGEVIILLGVRKAESNIRKERIKNREIEGKLTNPHNIISGAYVFNPIVELTTDQVWSILLSNGGKSPWNSNNYELYSLYADSDGGECPFTITSTKETPTPSCGKSRFGCWVCTVVKEDKSLIGFIKSGEEWLIPLAEFRNWLLQIRDDPNYRDTKRRDGKIYYKKGTDELGFGPFTLEARLKILKKLLETQKKVGMELITLEELKMIDEIWDNEGDLTKRSLVDIYYEIIGQKLPWDKYKKELFEDKIVEKLKISCDNFNVPFELMIKLILAVENNKFYTYKHKLKNEIENILNEDWLHYKKIEEIENVNK